jgi:hypothetical protein
VSALAVELEGPVADSGRERRFAGLARHILPGLARLWLIVGARSEDLDLYPQEIHHEQQAEQRSDDWVYRMGINVRTPWYANSARRDPTIAGSASRQKN